MAKSGQHGGNVLQMAHKFGVDPRMVLDFSANINPMGLPDSLKSALIENIGCLEHYPDIDYTELNQTLAQHVGCQTEWVLPGNGATELIFLWVHYFRPKTALLVEPSFAEYRRALERYECQIQSFDLKEPNGFALDDSLLDALSADLDCLFLCTPNNPTGLMPSHSLLEAVIDKCQALHIGLFIDESFIDFLPNNPGCSKLLDGNPHLYILRSMTKFYAMPGLRLGYLLSSNQLLLDTIRAQREPWTINAFAALSAQVVLNDDDYTEATHTWLNQQQTYLYHALCEFAALEVFKPSANYLFFKLNIANFDLQSALMKQQILIRHCANYPGLNHQFYRVAVKSEVDNKRLIEALKECLPNG